MMLFLTGVVQFCVWGVLLTKVKVVCMTLCMTYVVKIRPKMRKYAHGVRTGMHLE